MWKAEFPSQIQAFIWRGFLNKINTNDLMQLRRPAITFSPDICVTGDGGGDS